ncbi:MAG TPA: AMP-binding protein, partial [Microthrixaceae bacterium]|nr:AMP-binding protein [Microthrixaceae bacterium]
MSNGWNLAELWERIAARFPDSPAHIQGDRTILWSETDERANGVAHTLLEAGAQHQDKVALYLYNAPEYLEGSFAAYKAGLVPVNTNYRYVDDELLYLWDNADAVAVIFHGEFTPRIQGIRDRLPKVKTWLWVDDSTGPKPDWAIAYEDAAAAHPANTTAPWGRSGDDLVMIYTGGTTGMPKGVMWRQDDLMMATVSVTLPKLTEGYGNITYDELLSEVVEPGGPGLPACPLMHGTGWFMGNLFLSNGGCCVTTVGRKFDPVELLDTVERNKVQSLVMVGDAFGRPIVAALDENPGRWDISSLVLISSSGVMWSEPNKEALLRHNPGMLLVDVFSSSEAIGLGQSASFAGAEAETAKFVLGPNARVIAEDGSDVVPGSGQRGRVAVGGATPLGYYKDPEKSAGTFVMIDGRRFSIPGDWATVETDGTITLLGRGSVCINTAGEKVFPEEVEEVLKLNESILDAVVVGVPDDKFGQAITAVVEPASGATVDEASVIAEVKEHLAG